LLLRIIPLHSYCIFQNASFTPASYFLCLIIYWIICATKDIYETGGVTSENENCVKWWWTNLIFGNNFVADASQCMYWSWSIAVEFQFYIISPRKFCSVITFVCSQLIKSIIHTVFMMLLSSRPKLGRQVLWGVTIVSTLLRLGLTGYVFAINDTNAWVDLVYLTPWCRVSFVFLPKFVSHDLF
jgi:peptidoglycan/LPS O-acetylase OafA/YrhL